MVNINIYTYTTIKGPRKQPGAFAYILEMETDKGPATLSKTEVLSEVTQNLAELIALAAAVRRVKKPCALSIYGDCSQVAAAFEKNWVGEWIQNNWINAKGKPVANQKEWKEVAELLGKHQFQFFVGMKHSYYDWMVTEAGKEKKRCTKDLGNLTQQKK